MNEPFDPESTQSVLRAFKKKDPVWAALRENVTLKVAVGLLASLLVTSVTAIVQFAKLRGDVTDLKVSIKDSQERAAADAALHQHVEDLDDRLTKIEALRDYQQSVVSETKRKRR